MLRILNYEVYDLKESVIACRNAMRLEPAEITNIEFIESLERAKNLVKKSASGKVKSHDNFLTGIRVSFDMWYPQYITPQMQRYHFFDIVCSNSKMHRILKMDFSKCCNEFVTAETVNQMVKLVNQYNGIIEAESSYDSKEQFNNILHNQFMKIISNCPLGLELFERVSTNYKQLQTIYNQRKNHKLDDWRVFCSWIESLPYSKEFITG